MIFPSHHQSSKVSPPCKGAFDLPSSLVAAQGASILGWWFLPVFSMRTDQLNPPVAPIECAADRRRRPCHRSSGADFFVAFPVRAEARRPAPGSVQSTRLRPGTPSPSSFPKEAPGRLPPPSTSDPFRVWFYRHRPPFFRRGKTAVGKRLRPIELALFVELACNARHAFSQMPCASPRRNRRQHVLGEGDRSGRSFHRAPLPNTHKMPSNTGRLARGLGPPLGDPGGSGEKRRNMRPLGIGQFGCMAGHRGTPSERKHI